jgi:hypothetical protein
VEIDYFTLAFNSVLPGPGTCWTAYDYNYETVDKSDTQPTLTETGALPPGLGFDATAQTITGTPTQTGSWTFTVAATANGAATPVNRTDTITVTDPDGWCTPSWTPPPQGSVPGSFGSGPTASYFFPSDAAGLGTDAGTVTPAQGGTGAGGGGGGSGGAGAPVVPVKKGKKGAIYITVPFACKGPAECSATITARVILTYKGDKLLAITASKKPKHESVVIGKDTFTIPGATKQTVSIPVNSAGRELLRQRHSIPVRLTITEGKTVIGTILVKVNAPKGY